jgi:endoglucanase
MQKGLLHAHACDDLAAVAAALATLDALRKRNNAAHVGVLLTRAEEIGFIGAIAACKHKSVPKNARLICLENSRSYAESPIGGGPIVRVGDKSSVFGPTLTNRISAILSEHQKTNPKFKWQRKLMPGGTCEATTFSTYGYESTCLCLPLGNYHNMNDIDGALAGKRNVRVGPEFISLDDFHGMIKMLMVSVEHMDSAKIPTLERRMEELHRTRKFVL